MAGQGIGDPIRVLHLDDEENVLYFTREIIAEADASISLTPATSPGEALSLLADPPDCVVTDFKMPEMDGIAFARRVKERLDIPVILYTGQGSEEVASRAFEAGVSDYLRKEQDPSHIRVLAKRIRHAVESSRMARLHEEALRGLHASEQKLRLILDNSIYAVQVFTDGKMAYVNRTSVELLGYDSPEDMLGKDMLGFVAEESRPRVGDYYSRRLSGDSPPEQYELKLLRRDGRVITVETQVSLIEWEGKKSSLSFVRDLTPIIKSQIRLRQLHAYSSRIAGADTRDAVYRALFDAMVDALGFEVCGLLLQQGSALQEILLRGYTPGVLSRINVAGPGVTARAFRAVKSQLVNDTSRDPDYVPGESQNLFGSELAVPVVSDGVPVAVLNAESRKLGAFTDEDRMLLETLANQAGQALSRVARLEAVTDSEKRYRMLAENAADYLFTITLEGAITYMSKESMPFTGYTRGDYVGRSIFEFIPAEAAADVRSRIMMSVGGDSVYTPFTLPINRKGGGVTFIEVNPSPLLADGRLSGFQLVVRDLAHRAKHQKSLESLLQNAVKLGAATDENAVWWAAIDALVKSLGYERISVGLVRDGAIHFSRSLGHHVDRDFSLSLDSRGVSVKAVKTRRSQKIDDTRLDPGFVTFAIREDGTPRDYSNMAVPVAVRGEVVAVINIQHPDANVFTYEDVMLVETLALHASATIQRIRQQADNERHGRRLEVLHRHALELEHVGTLEEAVTLTYRALSDLRIQEPSIGILQADGVRFYAGTKPSSFDFTIPLTGRGVSLRAIRVGKTQIVPDTRLDPDYFSDPGGLPLLSEVMVPLHVKGESVGVLNLESLSLDAYSEEDVRFIEMLASHVSGALQRIREREGLQRLVDERTRELLTAEQMAAAGRVSAMVAHDLRAPLQTIMNATELVRRHPEKAAEALGIVDSVVERSIEMIEELRQSTRDDPLRLRRVNLARVIRETLREAPMAGIKSETRIDPEIGSVPLDALKVRRMLENLIRNAVEAMPGGGTLTVEAERKNEEITITVKDTGVGIPPEAMSGLFKPFVTTKKDGLGLGLVFCRRVAEMHGGSIRVDSESGVGTVFTVILPIHA